MADTTAAWGWTGPMAIDALQRAARRYGIRTAYRDIWGRLQEPPPETLRALLKALGAQEGRGGAPGRWRRAGGGLLPPWIVVCQDAVPGGLRLPKAGSARAGGRMARWRLWTELKGEDGGLLYEWEGRSGGESSFRIPLPRRVPLGYHRLRVVLEGPEGPREGEAQVACCPPRCHHPSVLEGGGKVWGMGLALQGLASGRNWGAGDLRDLEELVCWSAKELKAGFVGILPIHHLANRLPYNISPYFPSSRLYRNLVILDLESIPEFALCAEARRMASADALAHLRGAPLVEIPALALLKTRVLKALFELFLRGDGAEGASSPRGDSFRRYVLEEGAPLVLFATFSALEERFLSQDPPLWTWRQWPAPYQDPCSEAVRDFQRAHPKEILFHQWVQWLIQEQLLRVQQRAKDAGMPIGLLQDMALGMDPCGADAWAYPAAYVRGVTVGAPPDDFSPLGQNWGIPPLDPLYLLEEGFEPWVQLLQRNLKGAGALRLDHVMGLFRLFWIPEGGTPRDGTYVDYPARELLLLLALESHRNNAVIVGEDLGTLEPGIRRGLRRACVLSTRLLYFQRDKQGRFLHPRRYPRRAMVSITTHDLPTMVGFWEGRDIRWRKGLGLFPDPEAAVKACEERREAREALLRRLRDLGLLPEELTELGPGITEWSEELQRAVIRMLAATPCELVMVSLDDLTLEKEQLNLPGTLEGYPNWRRRVRLPLEALREPGTVERLRRMLEGLLAETSGTFGGPS